MKTKYKGFLIGLFMVIVIILMSFMIINSLDKKYENRVECMNIYLSGLDWNRERNCYEYACNKLNMSWASSGSWYYPEQDCEKEGVKIRVDWSNVGSEDCDYLFNRFSKMKNCIYKKGAEY